MNFSPCDGLHLLQIDTQDRSNRFITPLTLGIDACQINLTPATWRTA